MGELDKGTWPAAGSSRCLGTAPSAAACMVKHAHRPARCGRCRLFVPIFLKQAHTASCKEASLHRTSTHTTHMRLVSAHVPLQVFRCPRDVGEAIQDAVSMLQVPRSALGVTASSKGLVAGRVAVHDTRAGERAAG